MHQLVRPKVVLTVLAFSVAAVPLGVTSASAAAVTDDGPTWSTPATLVANAGALGLGAGVGGQEAATWLGSDDSSRASYRPAGQDWQAPQSVASGVPGDVVVDPSGRAVAAMSGALVSRSSSSPTWSSKETGSPYLAPELAVEGSGQSFAVVAWSEPVDPDDVAGGGSITRTWQGVQHSDGTWSKLADAPYFGIHDLAAYGHTDLMLVDNYRGIAVTSSVDHAKWSTGTRLLSAPSHEGGAPATDLATNARGAAVAVAAFRDGTVGVAYKPAGHAWEAEKTVPGQVPLGPQPGTVSTVAGTVSPSGQATVVYVDADSRVMTMRHPADGSWSAPQALSGPLPAPYSLRVTDDGLGNTVAAWGTDTKGAADVAQASLRPAGGAWQVPVTLGTPQTHPDFTTWAGRLDADFEPVKLAASPGRFTVAFRNGDGWDFSDLDVVTRFGGSNRYDTAVQASRATFAPGVSKVYVATGREFADGLAAGPAAAGANGPLLLVPGDSVPAAVTAEIQRLSPGGIVLLGGTGAISGAVEQQLGALAPVQRVAGANRYATAAALAAGWSHPATVYLAAGEGFADALSGGGLAAADDAPLLLSRSDVLPQPTADALTSLAPSTVVIVGGTAAVSDAVAQKVRGLLPDATVSRLAGSNRYATSAAVVGAWPDHGDGLVLATGEAFADALAGTPVAAHLGVPLALGRPTCTPAAVHDATAWADHHYLLGGTSALATATATTTCS